MVGDRDKRRDEQQPHKQKTAAKSLKQTNKKMVFSCEIKVGDHRTGELEAPSSQTGEL